MPEKLAKPYSQLIEMKKQLAAIPGSEYEIAFLNETVQACEDCRIRLTLETGPGYYREITSERRQGIVDFYEQAALTMYTGFANRMKKYAESTDQYQKQMAEVFLNIQQ